MIQLIQSRKRHRVFWETLPRRNFDAQPTIENDTTLIVVDPTRTYQTHLGFGGAFSEAAAVMFARTKHQETALDAYFSSTGLGYNLGRCVIHSSDFSPHSRTYIDAGDASLQSFSMHDDDAIIIPFIKRAAEKAKGLWLLASPWSPPAFMKTNQSLYYGGMLKPEFVEVWAAYIVRYLKGMRDRGLDIAAISIQNEPEAIQTWESCLYTIEQETTMVNALHKALSQTNLSCGIVIWDHNRDRVAQRACGVLAHASDKVWGIGHHWYVCEASENLEVVHDLYPDKHILFTEGCVEYSQHALNSGSQEENEWKHGEHYGRNIIKDSLHHTEGFIDWNLFLDEVGGPNHVENFCEAPIMIDRTTGALMYQPSYYFIGHFSKHIRPGAKRIHLSLSVTDNVHATSYKNPDGSVVVVVQNEGSIKQVVLYMAGQPLNLSLPDRSITTLIF
ncbi:MAG: glucosylceramidase [Acholeplasmatales bacterium]|nr:MAG: glucosylceramidase [Acholeplasmatales bacterium]